ncbi:MAG: glycosyltransferase, partial [Myxococcales bacterium]
LQPWSLAQKRWKKRPYWTLVERPRLANAAALHATSEMERTDLERLVPGVPVVVVPNGVDLPPAVQVPRDPRQVVFLGRLHPKKGLDILVTALARVARTFPDVHAVVAGPDDAAEWPRIERLLEGMSPRPRVRYVGEVKGEHKFRLLAQSAVFALPSHAENFGQAVVEAMSVGTPVLVSRNTPWSSVEARGAGAWLENTPEAFAEGLCRVLADPAGAAVMGTQASALAREFSWSSVGEAMAAAYASVLDRQPRPSP